MKFSCSFWIIPVGPLAVSTPGIDQLRALFDCQRTKIELSPLSLRQLRGTTHLQLKVQQCLLSYDSADKQNPSTV